MHLHWNKKRNRLNGRFYMIQFGDTLFSISQKFNVAIEDLRQCNDQLDGDVLFPGEILFIPKQTGSTAGTGGGGTRKRRRK